MIRLIYTIFSKNSTDKNFHMNFSANDRKFGRKKSFLFLQKCRDPLVARKFPQNVYDRNYYIQTFKATFSHL